MPITGALLLKLVGTLVPPNSQGLEGYRLRDAALGVVSCLKRCSNDSNTQPSLPTQDHKVPSLCVVPSLDHPRGREKVHSSLYLEKEGSKTR
jgi:hypothetical protein